VTNESLKPQPLFLKSFPAPSVFECVWIAVVGRVGFIFHIRSVVIF
jgi:hypothetical protein